MKGSILRGKRILAVGGEPDILEVIGRKILEACPSCQFDKAIHYIEAVERMVSFTYDLVILYIGGVRGFGLPRQRETRRMCSYFRRYFKIQTFLLLEAPL